MSFPPIAIVGQGCVLPGAGSPDALWSLVHERRVSLRRVAPSRWGLDAGVAPGALAREVVSDMSGYVDDFVFDPTGLTLLPDALRDLDPVFLWTLHAARDAVRSAGIEPGHGGARGTVVLGNLSYPTPGLLDFALAEWSGRANDANPQNRFMSGLPAHLVARALRFDAGAFALDAACASSLYAIKLACDRLHDGRADLALAGGVNHANDLFLHGGFSALKALSPSGRSRPFHRDADGLVPAQGCAMLLLERLDDALTAGRTVLGVIRGVGLSNDGRSGGLMVPAERGQVRALRAAYAQSGLRPEDISLIECHATGTPVGDAAEVRSLREVFEGVRALPIGSLKSNLGHLITASGAAAVIKVLGAMRHGVRPATLHADTPIDELSDGMFRLLHEEEPWTCEGLRCAAISNFGFGGNNAHLLLEEWRPGVAAPSVPRPRPPEPEPVAVVAQVVLAGGLNGGAAFADAVFAPHDTIASTALETLELDANGLRVPPSDLRAALPQQVLLIEAARRLATTLVGSSLERTSVLVGMQTDAEIARHSLRWLGSREWVAALPPSLRDGPLTAPEVVGCMPNIVANRLNQQLDLRAPSFAVCAEELSGVVALDLGVRALRMRDVDTVVVGAVDLSCEPVQGAAARALLPPAQHVPGDAAVVLVLKRERDARRDGDPVLALVDVTGDGKTTDAPGLDLALGDGLPGLTARFGHAHAASGLLHVAAAVEACHRRALPSRLGPMPWLPADGERRARVRIAALGEQRATVQLVAPTVTANPAPKAVFGAFAADNREALLDAVRSRTASAKGDLRLAVVGATRDEFERRLAGAASAVSAGSLPTRASELTEGVYFGRGTPSGELAFVYTGAAGAYQHMGRDLALALPELLDRFATRARTVRDAAGWVFTDEPDYDATPEERLWGASFLAQLHTEFTRHVLGLSPHAAIGYCSGETNALFALGAWEGLDEFRVEISDSRVYDRELCGELRCLRTAWSLQAGEPAAWSTWRIRAPRAEVRAAVTREPRAHLVIVNAPSDVVVAGEPEACARIAARFPRRATRVLGYDFVMHCPEAREFEARWRALHTRPTRAVPGVRFYTHATLSSYEASTAACADALTGQAVNAVDFPALIERAWADGVRVFIEHGPHAGCTKWIDEILGEREHLAVALDRYGTSSLQQALEGAARLFAAGIPVDVRGLAARCAPAPRAAPAKAPERRLDLRIAAHPPAIPPAPATRAPSPVRDDEERMEPAPSLASVLDASPPARAHDAPSDRFAPSPTPSPTRSTPLLRLVDAIAAQHTQIAELHTAFLRQQIALQNRFMQSVLAPQAAVTSGLDSPVAHVPIAKPRAISPSHGSGRRAPSGPRFDRARLEVHASGSISDIFGPLFAQQDGYARQVRMPEPPLLLADRVLGIEGEPGTLGTGTIWTETDVLADSFYLHAGRMPAGLLVESGQADLMLISWLGADFLNKGDRVYRLLGCDLRSFGELPTIGDTLHYQISVDGHAEQGGVRLFFFRYDCWVNGELRMSVRNGQAGFFTDDELAGSAGVLWSPEASPPRDGFDPSPPPARCTRTAFSRDDITAFIEGRVVDCFGPGFERAETHTQTPTIAGGPMRLVDDVVEFDPAGGPWKRGYLRARLVVTPESWFFRGHFKNDPCMPGTLMLEGGLQAMQIYMTALGYTLEHDGGRFEPMRDLDYTLRCRGQATPSSREVTYEIFVEEVMGGREPVLYADILGSVDGRKAFHCKRMGLKLVPGWPLDPGRMQLVVAEDALPVAVVDGFRFDYRSLVACAWGRPSSAFGAMYARFDGPRRVPRLPGPPYHFVSRVTRVEGPMGGMATGSVAEFAYDVPPDAWYFADNGCRTMPLAVLLEVALQPCGWLASYAGGALGSEKDLCFRNLDGTGTQHREVPDSVGTLTVTTTLTSVSNANDIVIVGFDVVVRAGDELVYGVTTAFGFFTSESMAHQVGLPTTAAQRAELDEVSEVAVDLAANPAHYFDGSPRLGRGRLAMLDRVTGLWTGGGAKRLGRLRAEKRVAADQWFFKAHFFHDPVQPGSLGLEAMLQAVQALALELGLANEVPAARFETQAIGVAMTWKYRGQVVPENRVVVVDVEITRVARDPLGVLVEAAGSLLVDGKRIYEARGLGVRIVPRAGG
jgi:acyl transferase domain-containing protein/3-hydroxymyristoyl/3-hydroxydecanoyl-(acyl carrier protein) dehydratase